MCGPFLSEKQPTGHPAGQRYSASTEKAWKKTYCNSSGTSADLLVGMHATKLIELVRVCLRMAQLCQMLSCLLSCQLVAVRKRLLHQSENSATRNGCRSLLKSVTSLLP